MIEVPEELDSIAYELMIKHRIREGGFEECHCCGMFIIDGDPFIEFVGMSQPRKKTYCSKCWSRIEKCQYRLGHKMIYYGFASYCEDCKLPWYKANEVYCSALKPKPGKRYDTLNREWIE